MKHFKIASVLLLMILLLAACGQQPDISSPEDAVGLYSGPYEYGILPMSVPEISGADRAAFNPDKIFDYLATFPFAFHDYSIAGWEARDGRLYLTVRDTLRFEDPGDAYYYIKDAFALTDEALLRLPVFSHCRIEDEWLTADSALDFTGYEGRVFDSVPVADEAQICLSDDYYEIDTVQKFIDEFVNGRYKNAGAIGYVSFDYGNGQITGIYSEEEYEDEGGWEDKGDYDDVDAIDREDLTDDVFDPKSAGYGSLPKSLLGIEVDIQAETFDPDMVTQYLLAGELDLQECYYIGDSEVSGGRLSLCFTVYIDIDADAAYQYLKSKFKLSDDEIKQLPLFSGCSIHNGRMYTEDQWDLENDADPEEYEESYFNSIELYELSSTPAIPVAADAQIILIDYEDTCQGYYITVPQLIEHLSDINDEIYTEKMWFKFSSDEITAMIEEYTE